LNDMFHGEGKMQHSSGMVYEGQWVHGFPEKMATKIHIVMETKILELKCSQDLFSVTVNLCDDDDEIIPGESREIIIK